MKDIPETIFLQIDEYGKDAKSFKELETTWCTDKLNEDDIEYILKSKYDKLEQQKAEDKEFIEILCQQQAESALEYNKLVTEKAELIKIIQWIVDSVYPSDVDAFKLGMRHSLSAEHWIETVNSRFNSITQQEEKDDVLEQQKEKILSYINKLENDSFEEWNEDEKEGYLTACFSIKKKIEEVMK